MRPLLALLLLGAFTRAAASSPQRAPPVIREARWDDGREDWRENSQDGQVREVRRDHGGGEWRESSQNGGKVREEREEWRESSQNGGNIRELRRSHGGEEWRESSQNGGNIRELRRAERSSSQNGGKLREERWAEEGGDEWRESSQYGGQTSSSDSHRASSSQSTDDVRYGNTGYGGQSSYDTSDTSSYGSDRRPGYNSGYSYHDSGYGTDGGGGDSGYRSGYGSAQSGSASSSYGSPGYRSSYGSQSSYDDAGDGHQSGYDTDSYDGHYRSGGGGGGSYSSSSYDGGSYGSSSNDRSPDSSSSYDDGSYRSSSYGSSSYDRSPDSPSSDDDGSYRSSSYDRSPDSPSSYDRSYGSSSYDRSPDSPSSDDGGSYRSSSYGSSSYDRSPDSSSSYDRSYGSSSNDRSPDSSSSYDGGSYGSSSYDSGSYGGTYDSSTYDRVNYDSSNSNRGSYDPSSYDRGNYDSSNINRGTYDSSSINRGTYDSSSINRGTYDSSSINRGTYDSSYNYNGYGERTVYETNGDTNYNYNNNGGTTGYNTGDTAGVVGSSGFEPGKEYVYNYEGRVVSCYGDTEESQQQQRQEQQSTVSLRAVVTITANTHCDLKLKVDDFEVDEASEVEGEWLKEAVTQHHLHFSYQNGRVEAVCPDIQEATQATNIKKAILSAIQVSLPSLNNTTPVYITERDVSGECETKYTVTSEEDGRRVVVEKTKEDCLTDLSIPHLSHTSLHHQHQHHLSSSQQPPSQLPFVRRNQTCRLEKSGERWERVECEEKVSVDGPFSPTPTTTITITSSLVLSELPRPFTQPFHQGGRQLRRGHLRMELEEEEVTHDSSHSSTHHSAASDTLAQIADTIELLSVGVFDEDGPVSDARMQPQRFSHLVSLLATLQKDEDMQDVWNTYSQQEGYRELVMDAVKVCESGPCVRVMCLSARENHPALPRTALISWLTSLHFHTHVHPQAVSYLMDVVRERKDVKGEALMAASSLVYQMCLNHPHTCQQHARPFLEYSKVMVGESCGWGENRGRQSEVLRVLRALGNAGVLPSSHLPQNCFMNKMLKRGLRVSALHTNRRSGCISPKPAWM
ncbi:hypothetical protein Pcinc_029948, partial [Petrolisthes cinctipes]